MPVKRDGYREIEMGVGPERQIIGSQGGKRQR